MSTTITWLYLNRYGKLKTKKQIKQVNVYQTQNLTNNILPIYTSCTNKQVHTASHMFLFFYPNIFPVELFYKMFEPLEYLLVISMEGSVSWYLFTTFLLWSVFTLQPCIYPALARLAFSLHNLTLLPGDHLALLLAHLLALGDLLLPALLLGDGHAHAPVLLLTSFHTWNISLKTS